MFTPEFIKSFKEDYKNYLSGVWFYHEAENDPADIPDEILKELTPKFLKTFKDVYEEIFGYSLDEYGGIDIGTVGCHKAVLSVCEKEKNDKVLKYYLERSECCIDCPEAFEICMELLMTKLGLIKKLN